MNHADININFPTLQGCSMGSTFISAEVIAVTTFAVSSSNRLSRGPVILNLWSLDISSDLFDTLVAECKIRPNLVHKVEDITATFPFDGRKQRIRRGKPEDLTIFYSTIQRLWQKRPNLFSDPYEIEILIHVDDWLGTSCGLSRRKIYLLSPRAGRWQRTLVVGNAGL